MIFACSAIRHPGSFGEHVWRCRMTWRRGGRGHEGWVNHGAKHEIRELYGCQLPPQHALWQGDSNRLVSP